MSTSNQQTPADSGANERPPILEKGNYIPWESRFRRFLDNKLEEGDRMWLSIKKGPYKRPMIANPDNTTKQIHKPLSKMTEGNKNHVRHSRLMDEFDKFAAKEGESLESLYERLTTLVNIMDRNNVRPIQVSINTKFVNCLQPEWSKYVTMVRHNQIGDAVSYDQLYDSLIQFESRVLASKVRKAAKNHDPLALFAHSNASSSQSHANFTSFISSDEELEAPMEDQPLPVDASPTALSPGYIADSDSEEDEEDPEEDPADHPADKGDNDDNKSSDDDNNDDDVRRMRGTRRRRST
ncbi:hypothetical protein Tco_1447212 [Tanacetum coccineum]